MSLTSLSVRIRVDKKQERNENFVLSEILFSYFAGKGFAYIYICIHTHTHTECKYEGYLDYRILPGIQEQERIFVARNKLKIIRINFQITIMSFFFQRKTQNSDLLCFFFTFFLF